VLDAFVVTRSRSFGIAIAAAIAVASEEHRIVQPGGCAMRDWCKCVDGGMQLSSTLEQLVPLVGV